MSASTTRRSILDALVRKGNVMKAVMLRDMRTRFFNHGLGFLVVIIWPLTHIFVLLGLYTLWGRQAPYGDSLYLFFGTGLVPTLSFMYVSRMMVMSITLNKPMLHFPAIHITDIIFGRALLEVLGSFLMSAFVFVILTFLGQNAVPYDIPNAVAALCATLFLAIGMGSLFSLLAVVAPAVARFYMLFVIVIYLLSGTLFVPAFLPQPVIAVLSWNPVMHGVEWMRTAYFLDYPRQVLDKTYLLSFATISLFLGLFAERTLRSQLKSR